ncbi:hypothetical protein E1809_12695, partial [Arthrobacter terricola]
MLACRARHDLVPQSTMIRGVLSPGSDRRQGIANGDQTSRRPYRGRPAVTWMPNSGAAGHASAVRSERNSGGYCVIKDHESVDVFI